MWEPVSPNADDPGRWLVVYNVDDADSTAWAAGYQQRHGLPGENLLGLSLDGQEVIPQSAFEQLAGDVASYLEQAGLADRVMGILCGHGVPGAFERDADGEREAVASHLQLLDGTSGAASNPVGSGELVRPTRENLAGRRLAARIDGPTLAFSEGLSDRAAAVTATGLGADDATDPGRTARVWLDPHGGESSLYALRGPDLAAWAESVEGQRLRLPMTMTDGEDEAEGANPTFAAIYDDGFFWGWSQPEPPTGFFAEPAGQRVFCFQMGFAFATAATLRDVESTGWVMSALSAGYAATAGSVGGPHSASLVPRGERFFAAMERGWTLGEAWMAASGYVRTPLMLVGDPLMRVAMPRGGWNVYGGETLGQVDFDEPIARLREPARTWEIDAAHQPAEGGSAVYVVRHVSAAGHEEKTARPTVVRREDGALRLAPTAPSWPTLPGWRPGLVAEQWRIDAVWPGRLDRLRVTPTLEREVQGAAAEVIEQAEVASDEPWRAAWTVEPTGQRERFRICVSVEGGTVRGPWSAWVQADETTAAEVGWL